MTKIDETAIKAAADLRTAAACLWRVAEYYGAHGQMQAAQESAAYAARCLGEATAILRDAGVV